MAISTINGQSFSALLLGAGLSLTPVDCLGQATLSSTGGGSGLTPIAAYSTLSNNTSGSALPAAVQGLTLGVPAVTDTGVENQFTASLAGYWQSVWQNTSAAVNASTDLVLNNNLGTATTYYANLGINSSGYTGSGSLNLPSASYLTATSGDLSIGTTTANGIHMVVNGSATDALAVSSAGVVTTTTPATNVSTTQVATTAFVNATAISLTGTGSVNIDCSVSRNFYTTVTGNVTYAFTNAYDGMTIVVDVLGDASHTVTFTGVKYAGGTPPVQTLSQHDVWTFKQINSRVTGSSLQNVQ